MTSFQSALSADSVGQAKRALELAAKLEPSACVVSYDDYKIYDLMINGLKEIPLKAI